MPISETATRPGDLAPLRWPNRLFIDGQLVQPSTQASFDVIEAATEKLLFRVAETREADLSRAVGAARNAFDSGPWPRLTHVDRADHLRGIAAAVGERVDDFAQIWPRESGIVHGYARMRLAGLPRLFTYYADLADDFPFEERVTPTPSVMPGGGFGLLVREPVGVVGAIIPWNAPLLLITCKIAPALLAGCTVVLKASPEAPGSVYLMAEIAEAVGLPAGVLNVFTADREVSELLVRDPRVDKISFTGSTAAGRRIGAICGERVVRLTLELGGKSAAVVLDDADIDHAATVLAEAECFLSGQVCASLTRIIVSCGRHDELLEALAAASPRFGSVTRSRPACRWVPWPSAASATGSSTTSPRVCWRAPR